MRFRVRLLILASLTVITAAPAAAGPDDLAVVITNRNYVDGASAARFAHRDGDVFAKAAVDVLGVERARIRLHQDTTAAAMRRIFAPDGDVAAGLRGRSKARLVVYYSGLGAVAASRPTLLPIDVAAAKGGSEGYPLRSLVEDAVALVGSEGEVLVVVEAGFPGLDGQGWSSGLARKGVAVMLAAGVGTAALADEPAAKSTVKGREQGVFTDVLIEGLYGPAADAARRITVGDLHRFATRRVADRIALLFPGQARVQVPELLAADPGMIVAMLPANPIARDPAAAAAALGAVAAAPKQAPGSEKAPAPKSAAVPPAPSGQPAASSGTDASIRQQAPGPAKSASEAQPAADDRIQLVKSIHKELRRAGCEPGGQAVWGTSLTRALEVFQRAAKTKLDAAAPSPAILAALQARKGRVCPLTCDDDEIVVGNECRPRPAPPKAAPKTATPKAPEKRSTETKSSETKRPAQKAKAAQDDDPPAKHKAGSGGGGGGGPAGSGGDCASVMFNGQVCTDGRGRTCVQRFHQRICTY